MTNLLFHCNRQFYGKGGLFIFAVGSDRPAMQGDDFLGDGKAKTGAAEIGRAHV